MIRAGLLEQLRAVGERRERRPGRAGFGMKDLVRRRVERDHHRRSLDRVGHASAPRRRAPGARGVRRRSSPPSPRRPRIRAAGTRTNRAKPWPCGYLAADSGIRPEPRKWFAASILWAASLRYDDGLGLSVGRTVAGLDQCWCISIEQLNCEPSSVVFQLSTVITNALCLLTQAGGKSGLHRARWWVTPTPGNGSGSPARTPAGGKVQQKVYRPWSVVSGQ